MCHFPLPLQFAVSLGRECFVINVKFVHTIFKNRACKIEDSLC